MYNLRHPDMKTPRTLLDIFEKFDKERLAGEDIWEKQRGIFTVFDPRHILDTKPG